MRNNRGMKTKSCTPIPGTPLAHIYGLALYDAIGYYIRQAAPAALLLLYKDLFVAVEQSFVMLKPGTLQRRVIGEIISRFERKGLKLIALKLMHIDRELAKNHYAEHEGKDFYPKLMDYTVSGPVVAMVLEGDEAISMIRRLAGPTEVSQSLPGTIRGDFCYHTRLNLVHASDSAASAEREIPLFFRPEELIPWEDGNERWF